VTAHGFFGTSLRRDSDQPRDLGARIEAELRERIEEAVDFACLDALVERRRARGLPAPVADSARDREEFTQNVRAFLEHLRDAIAVDLTPEQRRRVEAAARAAGDETRRLLAAQLALAKELPDYWQRFEASRVAYVGARSASGGERRGLLGRLFGRG
jgi:NCAIR mutase (PurE)-related protein